MSEPRTQLHPDVSLVIRHFYTDAPFRMAAQDNLERALAEYELDEHERQALQLLLTNLDRLPAAIAELPSGGFSHFLRSRTVHRMLSQQG